MTYRVHSSILQGIDVAGCEVEADVAAGGQPERKLAGLAMATATSQPSGDPPRRKSAKRALTIAAACREPAERRGATIS